MILWRKDMYHYFSLKEVKWIEHSSGALQFNHTMLFHEKYFFQSHKTWEPILIN